MMKNNICMIIRYPMYPLEQGSQVRRPRTVHCPYKLRRLRETPMLLLFDLNEPPHLNNDALGYLV